MDYVLNEKKGVLVSDAAGDSRFHTSQSIVRSADDRAFADDRAGGGASHAWGKFARRQYMSRRPAAQGGCVKNRTSILQRHDLNRSSHFTSRTNSRDDLSNK